MASVVYASTLYMRSRGADAGDALRRGRSRSRAHIGDTIGACPLIRDLEIWRSAPILADPQFG